MYKRPKNPHTLAGFEPGIFFVKLGEQLFLGTTVARIFGRLLQFSKKLPKINNRTIGESSPNPVTLFRRLLPFTGMEG
jgi:hypothetical protein